VLAGRYRVVAAQGKGGMGEVYRADDLTLGQPVALKFLPAPLAADPDRLTRFRKEVAAARRVSHPNVCRVYDIGEADGQAFLSMEYIDGEDLATLLRRIGRLPEDKATAIARELCLGLAAVHEQGLLHRDLKPQNVMLDGRGKVRLTDFGLAVAEAEVGATELRSGTPAYMAPEQLAGREVTAHSDLFALGLVLYELYTGRSAFRGTDRGTPPSKPSSHVSGLDPAVERIILRCLQPDPAARPRSALAVAGALPGGDPLAAALAAGEIPSPQLVADAGGEGTLRPAAGLALLGVVVVGIALLALLSDRVMLFRRVPLSEPPEVLARQARHLLERLGHADPPADTAFHFRVDAEPLLRLLHDGPSSGCWDNLAAVRPTPLYFFYRQSPRPLVPTALGGEMEYLLVTDDNPPPTRAGMAGVHLDPQGKLLRLYALPPPRSEAPPTPPDPDWRGWFDPPTVGFDLSKDLLPARPEWAPPCACDRQAAWIGSLPGRPDWEVRVEAAAYRGRPVYFEVMPAGRDAEPQDRLPGSVLLSAGFVALAWVILLAVRNLSQGRGDLRGAVRLGLAILAVAAGAWLLGGHHALAQETMQLALLLGTGGSLALLYGLSYLALEPAVRRRWPWRITAWNRLLDGRLGDPMVGRDLLVGMALWVPTNLLLAVAGLAAAWVGYPRPPLTGVGPFALRVPGPPTPLYVLISMLNIPILVPMMYLSLSFVLSLVLRREWLAWTAVFLLFTAAFAAPFLGPSPAANAVTLLLAGIIPAVSVLTVARFGVLAFAGASFCELLRMAPLTTDLSAWYAPQGVLVALVVIGLAGYAFVTAVGGPRLFRDGFFGDT
jgi:serine/threonine-protein kinase